MARPYTYTPEQLEKKINEYFKYIDENPLYRYEQKKGSVVIPKGFDKDISELNELIKIPLPKIYLETELCDWLGFDKDYLTDTLAKAKKRLSESNYPEDREKLTGKWNLNENDEKTKENDGCSRENDLKLVRIITRAKRKCTDQKLQLASAGLANPMIVSRIEGLKDQQDIKQDIEMKTTVQILKPGEQVD